MSTVLVIAGSDSSGGAGIARDIRTVTQLGGRAACAITAVTAQTHAAVAAVHILPPQLVSAQIEAAFGSATIGAVKIGMLANAATVRAVAAALGAHPQVPVVLDPVLAATSGAQLLDAAGIAALLDELLPRVTLLTPNIPEAARLLGAQPARDEQQMRQQSSALVAAGAAAVLLKGGHAPLAEALDLLTCADGASARFSGPRAAGRRRGSGCALSSAVAAALARGRDLRSACAEAKRHLDALFAQEA
jgi:hydroxymethylpyrimidine/phosphomethylpyrimidine kinase